jgi:ERCC4-type nuclease
VSRTRPDSAADLMPLQLDRRIGSAELFTMIAQYIPVELATLPAADAALVGRGPEGVPILIGIERKRISDLLQSVSNGRLVAGQLPELVKQYHEVWLLVEGDYLVDDHGTLLRPGRGGKHTPYMLGPKKYLAQHLYSFLLTLEHCAGVRVHRTRDAAESAAWLASLYKWWTGKAYEDHRSHLRMDRARDAVLLRDLTLVERWAAELPGVGMDRALAVGGYFSTALEMACADEASWREVPGIGKTLAKRIVHDIQEGS